jgi:hypothetical protein
MNRFRTTLSREAHAEVKLVNDPGNVELSDVIVHDAVRSGGWFTLGNVRDLVNELLALRDEVQELKDQLETADYDLIEARQDLEEARRKLAEVDG